MHLHLQLKWCPNKSCGSAVLYKSGGAGIVQCSCGDKFCFGCLNEQHAPSTCDMVKQWREGAGDEKDSERYMKLQTKICKISYNYNNLSTTYIVAVF